MQLILQMRNISLMPGYSKLNPVRLNPLKKQKKPLNDGKKKSYAILKFPIQMHVPKVRIIKSKTLNEELMDIEI